MTGDGGAVSRFGAWQTPRMESTRVERRGRTALIVLAMVVAAVACGKAQRGGVVKEKAAPTRVLVIVVDQLRTDLIDRGGMKNVARLRDRGASYPDAIVGHMSAKTVVSHAVIPRGVEPRRVGWSDDLFRDSRGILGSAGAIWVSGSLTLAQMQALMPEELPPSIAKAFDAHPRRASVAVKGYAATAMAGAEDEADMVVTLSGKLGENDAGPAWKGWMKPVGEGCPAYVCGGVGTRFWVDGRPAHGTEKAAYSLGGNKFVPGTDRAHLGGDVWTADAAIAILEREDWGALFVSFGGVDKVGHMFGADRDLDHPNPSKIRIAEQLRTVDEQIGRLLAALEKRGVADETLVILTADHGGTYVENHRARALPAKAGYDWSWGVFANDDPTLDPQPDIARLVSVGGVQATSTDTALRVWTVPGTDRADALVSHLKSMPGVVAVYRLAAGGDHYQPVHEDFAKLGPAERAFQETNARALMATMASPASANLVALLDEKTGYGTIGDHGGTQSAVQRIPLILSGPGVKSGKHAGAARLMDVAPTVWRLAGKPAPAGIDGKPLCAAIARGCD